LNSFIQEERNVKERVRQCVLCCHSSGRVVCERCFHELNCFDTNSLAQSIPAWIFNYRQVESEFVRKSNTFNPILLCDCSFHFANGDELIQFARSGKKRPTGVQFTHQTANSPNVDRSGVNSGSKKNLRSSIPFVMSKTKKNEKDSFFFFFVRRLPSCCVICRERRLVSHFSRKTQIAYLDCVILVKKNVFRFL
jgi:hypothetical protein